MIFPSLETLRIHFKTCKWLVKYLILGKKIAVEIECTGETLLSCDRRHWDRSEEDWVWEKEAMERPLRTPTNPIEPKDLPIR